MGTCIFKWFYHIKMVNNDNENLKEKKLPIGWKAGYSDGVIYCYNEYTNESRWEEPKVIFFNSILIIYIIIIQ